MRRRSWFWGALLIVLGLVLLVERVTDVSIWQWLWPTALILFGLWILLGFTAARRPAEVTEVVIPLEGAARAHLRLGHGAGRLRVGPGSDPTALLTGRCGGGVTQRVTRGGDRLEVHLHPPRDAFPAVVFPWTWGSAGAFDWTLELNGAIPLSLDLDVGAGETQLDLENLQVTGLELDTGASSVAVTLPAHAGHTRVDVDAGVASVNLRVPDGVAASVQVQSGLSGISIDRERFPRTGKLYRSPDYDTAENRVEIDIEAGVGSITVR